MTDDKKVEDDTEAMLLVTKLFSRGYKSEDVRRYMEQVERASSPLGEIKRRWFDPSEPRWVTR